MTFPRKSVITDKDAARANSNIRIGRLRAPFTGVAIRLRHFACVPARPVVQCRRRVVVTCPFVAVRTVHSVFGVQTTGKMTTIPQGSLLDVLKKKMRQTKEEMERYKDECEEYNKRLQVEVIRREEVSARCIRKILSVRAVDNRSFTSGRTADHSHEMQSSPSRISHVRRNRFLSPRGNDKYFIREVRVLSDLSIKTGVIFRAKPLLAHFTHRIRVCVTQLGVCSLHGGTV